VKEKGKWIKVRSRDRKEYKNTIWSVNWLPLGGFVRIKGEQGEAEYDADSFHTKPIWQRIIILAAGVGMNWILAAVLLSIGLMVGVPAVTEDLPDGATVHKREVTVADVLPGSAADQAGIQSFDIVISIQGEAAASLQATRDLIFSRGTEPTAVVVRRGDELMEFTVTSAFIEEIGREGMGIAMIDTGLVSYPPLLALQNGIILTGLYTKAITLTFIDLIRDLVGGGRDTVSQVSGPVGIAVMTGRVAEQGFAQLIQFTALLSINLAVLNFLPIPALDGGRVVFLVVEALRRKPVNRRTEAIIHNVAFLILVALIILITLQDIGRYFR
jgi:regulator of sigma E protease